MAFVAAYDAARKALWAISRPGAGPPPKTNRHLYWEYDRTLYRRRNVAERFFRRVK
jgi:transposase